jgi:hypothetical protein
MKTNLDAKFSLLAVLFLAAAFIVGCKTTPPIDWNSRVGTYTYDQAVTDLGPPDRQAKLSDGKTVAEWITHRSGGTGFSVGTGFFNGPVGIGVGESVGSGYADHVLKLTFDTNNKLSFWQKNY